MREDLLIPWKNAIKKAGKYTLHNCSMCNYPCGWLFENDVLYFDSGCDCTRSSNYTLTDDGELMYYLTPEHGHIERIEKFIKTYGEYSVDQTLAKIPKTEASTVGIDQDCKYKGEF